MTNNRTQADQETGNRKQDSRTNRTRDGGTQEHRKRGREEERKRGTEVERKRGRERWRDTCREGNEGKRTAVERAGRRTEIKREGFIHLDSCHFGFTPCQHLELFS